MPKRTDIHKILIIGSGPIVIGQACEFDYSGTQACKALREEGYEVILVNSNPATIMTDPEIADRTYIEPIDPEIIEKIIARERPDALLPTLGGQTALNTAVILYESGVLQKYGVEMIGAQYHAIKKGEDRAEFNKAMERIGLKVPVSRVVHSLEEALEVMHYIGFPAIIRPAYTLGGTGGGIAYNQEEFVDIVKKGLELSLKSEVQIDRSLIGWKEYELEVMRDKNDNVVVICSIENFDPMGVHTGDSITVAPAQTLTDQEYQRLRDYAIAIIREIGVETGGSNIQFAVNPKDGEVVVIEMNPRVSRSSALASKATGFPIAKIAAKLSVGYTLDEIQNDITKETPASFEPTLDYVVVKVPRFNFEKFKGTIPVLGTQMQSVGEVMSIGRTFKEAFQKALRSLEKGWRGWEKSGMVNFDADMLIEEKLRIPSPDRVLYIKDAFLRGWSIERVYELSGIDPWFLKQLVEILEVEKVYSQRTLDSLTLEDFKEIKQYGFSDAQIAEWYGVGEVDVRQKRQSLGVLPTYKLVDTCAAEFEARTPYYYSTYEDEDEVRFSPKEKVMILGSGPNRIGQGVEFDYACVHAAFALRDMGYESIMVNSNPETVSTDYDTSDRLYFEPLTFEDVMNIYEKEKPLGVILQFGGQTPLKLAKSLEAAGVPILGTSSEAIDIAEDRDRFRDLVERLGFKQPPSAIARNIHEVADLAEKVGYPILARPSYVLGGRAMVILYNREDLERYLQEEIEALKDGPVLIDKFLDDAQEVDVDALGDGEDIVIAGIMQHIEEAGIHSGDSAMVLPPVSLSKEMVDTIIHQTIAMGKALKVKGLMNVQYAIKDNELYFIEVNPRASRTVPFVSKATGRPWAKLATQIVMGRATIKSLGLPLYEKPHFVSVKEVVIPFQKFPKADVILGPEMKSTGEVMGIDRNFARAFIKAEMAAGDTYPTSGNVLITVNDRDKPKIVDAARRLVEMGYHILATENTAKYLKENQIPCEMVFKLGQGRPDILDLLKNHQIHMILNTPASSKAHHDDAYIRRQAIQNHIPLITTVSAIYAAVEALAERGKSLDVQAIQEYYKEKMK
ncbi:carbamoyl-phosphate synthase large subunit [Thermospira aquatica]|uniref:Carbamoyl phosphate synthase large chain n=1 Tax=Thermospira aquatica TaxID=2828656 RepID=A0AAX3BBW4_9SPIR|nr:carbamoyl-phosphate synthase large subunit [Thermospira aquatica]URA09489.1 carbamoyl-phosphate synthase large subunit [Thermospira aquatica]